MKWFNEIWDKHMGEHFLNKTDTSVSRALGSLLLYVHSLLISTPILKDPKMKTVYPWTKPPLVIIPVTDCPPF